MSEAALRRIQKAIEKLGEQQDELCERVAQLGERVERLAGSRGAPAVPVDEVIRFLDGFRAAEALGEASLGAWLEVATTDCVRGGLRVIQQREGMHARLLGARLRELGGAPQVELPTELRERQMKDAGDPSKSDAQKLLEFVQRFPDADAALKPIYEMADRLDGDAETQYLLRAIAQDERSTLEFLKDACALLNPTQ